MSLISHFYHRVSDQVIARPALILLIMALLALASFASMGNLSMESGVSIYLTHEDPSMIWYQSYVKNFADEKTIVLYISTPDPLSYDVLHDLSVFEEEVSRIPGVMSVTTIASVIKQANGGTLPPSKSQIQTAFDRIPASYQQTLVPDSVHTFGAVLARGDPASLLEPIGQVISSSVLPPGTTIEISGTDAFDEQMLDAMTGQIVVMILGAFTLMLLGLLVLFSSVRYRLLPLLFVMLGLIYLFGVLGAFRVNLNIGAIGAFPVLLGLGIDYAVQFQSRLNDELINSPLHEAIRTTICNTGYAVLNAMIATVMGFIVLYITPLPILVGFTQTAIIGIFCAYGATLFGFPALALLLPYKPKISDPARGPGLFDRYNHLLSYIAGKIAKSPVILLILVLMLAGIGLVVDDRIAIDTTEDSMVPPDMPAKVVKDKIEMTLGSQMPVELIITAPDITSLETLRWMDRYGKFISEVYADKIISVSSIASLVKKYNDGTLPRSQTALNTILSRIPADEKRKYVADDITGLMEIKTISLSAGEMSNMKEVLLSETGWPDPPPGLSVHSSGEFELNAITHDDIVLYKPIMTYLAFIMIFLFLLIAYRNIIAVAPLFPIICVVGWNAVVMWVFSIDYTFITASLGAITIGVSSEYTILMMERYLEEKKTSPDSYSAIRNSVQKIGASVTVSGLVTAFGFSALLLSSFPIISNFGIMTVIAVFFSLIGAIIIMPAILALIGAVEEWLIRRRSSD
ncbi:MAG TPA: hydrophobe/amphiphile efflux-3 (HAE3) family transporter [Methanospirillum sp.]|uniref:efflux RND transporter permease subunit n=1 Tax=Methanospirillum sp. TaxID=45200 RepID=UPI002BB50A64|nr:hydrophobe/amphiphile efflux-3 (HAE3) family transporter [Methanospirillum sp.]HOJ95993.1 hydrophobe/amphiphile efflux-3 (HAE3) family transporter [Methanospirillum sp.]HPP77774.1 hydrophobe/amphiphile efflux-3 (HAE3) family transporter [Methanospirillum sp.]